MGCWEEDGGKGRRRERRWVEGGGEEPNLAGERVQVGFTHTGSRGQDLCRPTLAMFFYSDIHNLGYDIRIQVSQTITGANSTMGKYTCPLFLDTCSPPN